VKTVALTALTLVLSAPTAGAAASGSPREPGPDPAWVLVRGEQGSIGGMSWDRIARVYLGSFTHRVVTEEEAPAFAASSRMVVGTPEGSAVVREVATALGVVQEGDELVFRGRRYELRAGLVLVTDDPDGGGLVALLCGAHDEGVHSCFTTSISVARRGWLAVMLGERLEGGWLAPPADATVPEVVRLDQRTAELVAAAGGRTDAEAVLSIARGLAGYADVHRQLLGPYADLFEHARTALVAPAWAQSPERRAWAVRDLAPELRELHARLERELGPSPRPAPVVHVLWEPAAGTNAKTFGVDDATGRPQVLLNLARLGGERVLAVAALHELVHARGGRTDDTLWARALDEGLATHVSMELEPGVGAADALFWSAAELEAARARRAALVAAFREDARSRDAAVQARWLQLDRTVERVPGSPSRCGYWLALEAVRAWRAAHPGATARELFEVPHGDLLAALR